MPLSEPVDAGATVEASGAGGASPASAPPVVVMGVSAVGKTTVGLEMAQRAGWRFIDADGLHTEAAVAQMRAGIPLTDDDRWPWLERVGDALQPGTVVACSALKRAYRDALRRHAPATVFIHLRADAVTLLGWISQREGHFMPAALLQSQFDTLEPLDPDEAGTVIDVDDLDPAEIAAHALTTLRP